jgi:integral membrane protein
VTEPTAPVVSLPSVAKPLRIMSLVEATSYLVLLGGVVAKRVFDAGGEGGVPILGPVHGTLYLVFALLAMIGRDEQGWSGKQLVLALVLGAIPLAGYYVERKMITIPSPS